LKPTNPLVVLLDVDNTLLDNDRFAVDLSAYLLKQFGADGRDRYWRLFAQRRDDLGYADYLGAVQAFRGGYDDDRDRLGLSAFVLDYPFAERLYPRALEVLAHLRACAPTVIFTEGDLVFQPRKLRSAGIWDAAGGQAIVCLHKTFALTLLHRRYPAAHYFMIDDKPALLAAMKRLLGTALTTVLVHQGQYARESSAGFQERRVPPLPSTRPRPDLEIERIADLLGRDPTRWGPSAPTTRGQNLAPGQTP
jgi:FMN phosphatase YigB (HAD superfamily)